MGRGALPLRDGFSRGLGSQARPRRGLPLHTGSGGPGLSHSRGFDKCAAVVNLGATRCEDFVRQRSGAVGTWLLFWSDDFVWPLGSAGGIGCRSPGRLRQCSTSSQACTVGVPGAESDATCTVTCTGASAAQELQVMRRGWYSHITRLDSEI